MQLRVRNSRKRMSPQADRRGKSMDSTADQTKPGTRNPTVKKTTSKLAMVIGTFPKCESSCCLRLLFHDLNLLLRQPVQLVHQLVDLAVGGVDLSLQPRLLVPCFHGSRLPVQGSEAP